MDININYEGKSFNVKNISIDGSGISIKGKRMSRSKQIHQDEIYTHDGGIYYPYTVTETLQEISIIIPNQDIKVSLGDEIISKYNGED